MTDHYIGVQRGFVGGDEEDFFFGTSSTSKQVEVRIDDDAGWTRFELALALSKIAEKITKGGYKSNSNYPVQ
jgi:hypothetical protein